MSSKGIEQTNDAPFKHTQYTLYSSVTMNLRSILVLLFTSVSCIVYTVPNTFWSAFETTGNPYYAVCIFPP